MMTHLSGHHFIFRLWFVFEGFRLAGRGRFISPSSTAVVGEVSRSTAFETELGFLSSFNFFLRNLSRVGPACALLHHINIHWFSIFNLWFRESRFPSLMSMILLKSSSKERIGSSHRSVQPCCCRHPFFDSSGSCR